MVPEDERVSFSAMTGQSLFYMAESDVAHKVLAVSEEEGAGRASYALKLLQSEGELSIASTGKDGTTARRMAWRPRIMARGAWRIGARRRAPRRGVRLVCVGRAQRGPGP